jgi:UDP-GlcNAc:undecaprenyl-phosphate GlcNAc-1-phosphate transferase
MPAYRVKQRCLPSHTRGNIKHSIIHPFETPPIFRHTGTMAEISLVAATVALIATLCVVFYAPALGRLLKIEDHPDGKLKTHDRATPLVGGPGMFAGFFLYLFTAEHLLGIPSPYSFAMILCVAVFFAIGLIDDRHHLAPWLRLTVLGLVVLATNLTDPTTVLRVLVFPEIGVTIPLGFMAIPFTIFTVLCFQNSANMMDGMNGLLLGAAFIWLALLSPFIIPATSGVFVVFLVALLILFAGNMRGRLFCGDSGSYMLAIVVTLSAITTYNFHGGKLSAGYMAICFLIPTIDMGRLMAQRMIAGKNPFTPDRTHLHHLLMSLTDSPAWTLAIYWGLCALPVLYLVDTAIHPFIIGPIQLALYGVIVFAGLRRLGRPGDELG